MSRHEDFGEDDAELGSDRSQTPEDAALHGQPTDELSDLDLGPREESYAESEELDEQK